MICRVLVVDTDIKSRAKVCSTLRSLGYDVIKAADGEQGYELFLSDLPDIILTEILLPKLNGMDMIKKIRSRADGKDAKIFLMTNMVAFGGLGQSAMDTWGIDGAIGKPVGFGSLLNLLGENKPKKEKLKKKRPKSSQSREKKQRGDFANISFAKLLLSLNMDRATGKLVARSEEKRILIYFRDGRPVHVSSNFIKELSLGAMLKKMGVADRAQLNASREMAETNCIRQGEALCSLGILTKGELQKVLKKQLEEKIAYIFGWEKGRFIFSHDPKAGFKKPTIRTTVPDLFLKGVTTYVAPEKITARFEDCFDWTVEQDPEKEQLLARFKLSVKERSMLISQDGITIIGLIENAKIGKTRALQILYTLVELEIYKLSAPVSNETTVQNGQDDTSPEPDEVQSESAWTASPLEGLNSVEAEKYYAQGLKQMKAGYIENAAQSFIDAINISSKSPKYLVKLAKALSHLPHELIGNLKNADFTLDPAAILKNAITLNDHHAEAFLQLGILSKQKRLFQNAYRCFARVIYLEPKNKIALREKKLLEMRLRKEDPEFLATGSDF